jgi:hypothetical protein
MALLEFLRRSLDSGDTRTATGDYNDNLLVTQGMPPYAELSRRNKGWQVMNTTALAALVVRPSTVANFTLFNNNTAASQVAFVIDRAWAFNLVTTDAVLAFSLWGCVHPTGMTAPTADITAIKSMSGLATAYSGGAIADTGATVVDNGWFPLVGSPIGNPGGVTPGTSAVAEIAGRIVIPPTAAMSIQVVASLVGDTFTTGFSWFEVVLPRGGN